VEKRSPNDLSSPVPKFCLAVEEFRRTAEGRVRTSQEFLQHFFPHDAGKVTDRVFKFLPNEVRGPVLTSWGLRGAKSALKDTDDKVQSVVWDALLAGAPRDGRDQRRAHEGRAHRMGEEDPRGR
jgi:hypothetical protein